MLGLKTCYITHIRPDLFVFHQPHLPTDTGKHASLLQVQVLEHDKHVITEAFERVVGELQADLQELRSRCGWGMGRRWQGR